MNMAFNSPFYNGGYNVYNYAGGDSFSSYANTMGMYNQNYANMGYTPQYSYGAPPQDDLAGKIAPILLVAGIAKATGLLDGLFGGNNNQSVAGNLTEGYNTTNSSQADGVVDGNGSNNGGNHSSDDAAGAAPAIEDAPDLSGSVGAGAVDDAETEHDKTEEELAKEQEEATKKAEEEAAAALAADKVTPGGSLLGHGAMAGAYGLHKFTGSQKVQDWSNNIKSKVPKTAAQKAAEKATMKDLNKFANNNAKAGIKKAESAMAKAEKIREAADELLKNKTDLHTASESAIKNAETKANSLETVAKNAEKKAASAEKTANKMAAGKSKNAALARAAKDRKAADAARELATTEAEALKNLKAGSASGVWSTAESQLNSMKKAAKNAEDHALEAQKALEKLQKASKQIKGTPGGRATQQIRDEIANAYKEYKTAAKKAEKAANEAAEHLNSVRKTLKGTKLSDKIPKALDKLEQRVGDLKSLYKAGKGSAKAATEAAKYAAKGLSKAEMKAIEESGNIAAHLAENGGKVAAKAGMKIGLRMGLRAIPVVGGAYFAYEAIKQGDYVKAGLELLGGFIPFLGSMAVGAVTTTADICQVNMTEKLFEAGGAIAKGLSTGADKTVAGLNKGLGYKPEKVAHS